MATKLHPGDTNKDKSVPALMNGSLTPGERGSTAWPVAGHDTGMVAATAWVPQDYEKYTFPSSQWTAEIRFPIRQTSNYSTQAGVRSRNRNQEIEIGRTSISEMDCGVI